MKIFAIVIFSFALMNVASAQFTDATETIKSAKSAPSLKAWMQKEKQRLGADNPGYRMEGPKDLCDVMKSSGLGCTYNDRGDLVQYLFAQGVDLFPCEGGSNPYTRDMCGKMDINKKNDGFHNFVGRPIQNKMLKESIVKNRALFRNGDLTAAAASSWKK